MGKCGSCNSSSLHSCCARFPLKTSFKNPGAWLPLLPGQSVPAQPAPLVEPRAGRGAGWAPLPLGRTTTGCGEGRTGASLTGGAGWPVCPSTVNWAHEGCYCALQTLHRWAIHPIATTGRMALWDIPKHRECRRLQLCKGKHRAYHRGSCARPAPCPAALWGAAGGGTARTGMGGTGSTGGLCGCKGTGRSSRAPRSEGSSSRRTPPSSEGAESRRRGRCARAGVWGSSHLTHLQRNLILFVLVV